jgi:aspartate racemase
MNTIGLIGGMSWESTQTYYQLINQGVKARLGGLHSAKIILHSLDFAEIAQMQKNHDWDGMLKILGNAATQLEKAGADTVLICTNTMHKLAPDIEAMLNVPLLHIADATAMAMAAQGIKKVGLLGTAFTMEQDFFKGVIEADYGIEVITPNSDDRALIHQVIYEELCLGKVLVPSKQQYLRIIDALTARGAEGIILGCTEIGMLITQKDTEVPLFDTTAIHAQAAVEFAVA